MKYVYYALIVIVLMEFLAMGIKGGIIGQNNKPWQGGNGCNLIGGKGRLPCCTPHDHAYKEGGWIGRRWDADAKLFSCMWKQGGWNYLLAPAMFVGVRAVGMWTFQWGKWREISYPIAVKE